MLIIDGASGEGGGQVLRTSLALSCITGEPFRIINIRAMRPKPGLRPQHLKSVEAAAAICGASTEGVKFGSQEIVFSPGKVKNKQFTFEIGTAGSTSLLFQTICLPLSLSGGNSHLLLSGGTHVPWSPCFDYLSLHWLHFMELIGFHASMELREAGFYPRGGGHITCRIKPAVDLKPLHITNRGNLLRIRGVSGVSNLDLSIATRQKHRALTRLEPILRDAKIRTTTLPGPSTGTYLLLLAEFEKSQCCFFSLGKKGKRAETVADEAVNELMDFMGTEGAIDRYLADQLLLPLSFAQGKSTLTTSRITKHLLTNRDVIQAFLSRDISIRGQEGQPGVLEISGVGLRQSSS